MAPKDPAVCLGLRVGASRQTGKENGMQVKTWAMGIWLLAPCAGSHVPAQPTSETSGFPPSAQAGRSPAIHEDGIAHAGDVSRGRGCQPGL